MPSTMAQPTKGTRPGKGTVKTSLSCPRPIYDFGQAEVDAGGFRSFSALVEHLLRQRLEARTLKQ